MVLYNVFLFEAGTSNPMKLLHTSDWHLGRALYGRKRYDEFTAFLDWLAAAIVEHEVDVLLVAGDIFDTCTPSNRAQALYYDFLCRVAASSCRHVVVIAGNHDSPTFLNAPRALLKALQVHVIGSACEDPADEVLVLHDATGQPELIVCAVPYLRDRDVRIAAAGESVEDKERKLLEGIRNHYAEVVTLAEQQRARMRPDVPLVGMGHLFTAGGQTIEGDGVRELYVGSLAHVTAGIFPDSLDYVALGHLHVPQKVGGFEARRYSGSPIPMGFGEAGQQKSVCLVALEPSDDRPRVTVELLPVPVLQPLARLRGDWNTLSQRIEAMKADDATTWLEIIYSGELISSDLRDQLGALVQGSRLEILRVKNQRVTDRALAQMADEETLDDLSVDDVFGRCLAAHDVPAEQRPELLAAYREAVKALQEGDLRAE